MHRLVRRSAKMLRASVRFAVFALVAFAVLTATARAGSTYVFCTAMNEARAEACCSTSSGESPQFRAAGCACCQVKTVGSLPNAFSGTAPHLPPPTLLARPLAATAVLATDVDPRNLAQASTWRASSRAGPPPFAVERARLMVFLI